jgi:hypothetical protein
MVDDFADENRAGGVKCGGGVWHTLPLAITVPYTSKSITACAWSRIKCIAAERWTASAYADQDSTRNASVQLPSFNRNAAAVLHGSSINENSTDTDECDDIKALIPQPRLTAIISAWISIGASIAAIVCTAARAYSFGIAGAAHHLVTPLCCISAVHAELTNAPWLCTILFVAHMISGSVALAFSADSDGVVARSDISKRCGVIFSCLLVVGSWCCDYFVIALIAKRTIAAAATCGRAAPQLQRYQQQLQNPHLFRNSYQQQQNRVHSIEDDGTYECSSGDDTYMRRYWSVSRPQQDRSDVLRPRIQQQNTPRGIGDMRYGARNPVKTVSQNTNDKTHSCTRMSITTQSGRTSTLRPIITRDNKTSSVEREEDEEQSMCIRPDGERASSELSSAADNNSRPQPVFVEAGEDQLFVLAWEYIHVAFALLAVLTAINLGRWVYACVASASSVAAIAVASVQWRSSGCWSASSSTNRVGRKTLHTTCTIVFAVMCILAAIAQLVFGFFMPLLAIDIGTLGGKSSQAAEIFAVVRAYTTIIVYAVSTAVPAIGPTANIWYRLCVLFDDIRLRM